MGRKRYPIKTGTIDTIKALSALKNEVARGVQKTVVQLAVGARDKARNTIDHAKDDIRQSMGAAKMKKQVGVAYDATTGTATVYAPVTPTKKNRNQMYWGEYGTGYHSKVWGYYTTASDKNPSRKKSKKTGRYGAVVKFTLPIGYMAAARRYLLKNTRTKVAEQVKLILTRKPRGYPEGTDKVFQSNIQGSTLDSKVLPKEVNYDYDDV